MTVAARNMAMLYIAAFVALAGPALAETAPGLKVLHDVRLDFDNDGRMDRALLVQAPGKGEADLHVYMGLGNEEPDLLQPPAFSKKDLTSGIVLEFESRTPGVLTVAYGCGGCSNDYSTTLKIIHRRGDLLVAGVTYDWETRSGTGSCDINFLTRKGVVSHGPNGRKRPVKARFKLLKLADWSEDTRPKVCGF